MFLGDVCYFWGGLPWMFYDVFNLCFQGHPQGWGMIFDGFRGCFLGIV